MALKEKALMRLCEKMQKAAVPFCLTGPWRLSLLDPAAEWHGFDVLTDTAHFPDADRVLTKLGMRQAVSDCEVHFHFDGADIQLYGMKDYAPSEQYACVSVLGQSVPVSSAEETYIWALMKEDKKCADMLLAYFQSHTFDKSCLTSFTCDVSQYLNDQI